METAKDALHDIALHLATLQASYGVTDAINAMEGNGTSVGSKSVLNFGLTASVYEWARGKPFKEIIQMTTVHEGSIVRCVTRLDELCRDFRNAARVIGNPSLYRKMEAASVIIKRDIVFAASLYL